MLRNMRSPRSWSVSTRRAFLLTLPISLPVWIFLMAAIPTWAFVLEAREAIHDFWSVPKRKRLQVVFRTGPAAGTGFPVPPRAAPAYELTRLKPSTAEQSIVRDADHVRDTFADEGVWARVEVWNWADGERVLIPIGNSLGRMQSA